MGSGKLTVRGAQLQPRTPGEARLMLLHERGGSLSEIARELDKDLSSVSRVNRGQRRSAAIEQAIADRLGLPLVQAFPEHEGGRP